MKLKVYAMVIKVVDFSEKLFINRCLNKKLKSIFKSESNHYNAATSHQRLEVSPYNMNCFIIEFRSNLQLTNLSVCKVTIFQKSPKNPIYRNL